MLTPHTAPDGQTDAARDNRDVYGVAAPRAPRSMRRGISPPPLNRPSVNSYTAGPLKTYQAPHNDHVRYGELTAASGHDRLSNSKSNGFTDAPRLPRLSEIGALSVPGTNTGGPGYFSYRAKDSLWQNNSGSHHKRGRLSDTERTWPISDVSEDAPMPETADNGAPTLVRLRSLRNPGREQDFATNHIIIDEDEPQNEYAKVHTADAADPQQSDTVSSVSRKNLGYGLSTLPSSHASSPRVVASRLPRSPPYSPPLAINCDLARSERAVSFNNLGQEPTNQPANNSILSMSDGGFARSYMTETASSTSTTSRTQNMCRGCRKSGNQLLPLTPCSKCRRGFHKGCGNPKPSQSASLDQFVCGRCLKREQKAAASDNSEAHIPSPRTSIETTETITVANLPTSSNHAATSGITKVHPGNDVPMPLTRAGPPRHLEEIPKASEAVGIVMRSDRYKHITCPWWQSGGCLLAEPHCEFAHAETGQDAPTGVRPAKDFTCRLWLNGRCYRHEDDCWYAHADTGLYLGRDQRASKKHITCYYWHSGHCTQADEACLYAHEETGIVAWQPEKEALMSQRGPYSLKSYTCPRWERKEPCRWTNAKCPYSHAPGGISCLEVKTSSHLDHGFPHTSMVNLQSTSHSSNGQSSPPLWARCARETPVNLRLTRSPTNSAPRNPLKEANGFAQRQSSRPPSKSLKSSIQASGLNATVQATVKSPKKHMAKRSGLLDPRRRNIDAIVPNQPSLTTAAQQVIGSETDQGIASARNSCDLCQKTIFISSRCLRCTESALAAEDPRSSVSGGGTLSPETILPSLEETSSLEMMEAVSPLDGAQPSTEEALMQALVANKLKRQAPDGALPAPKRPRLSATSFNQPQVNDAVARLRFPPRESSVLDERVFLSGVTQQAISDREQPAMAQAKNVGDMVEEMLSSRHTPQLAMPQKLPDGQNSMSASPHISLTFTSPPVAEGDSTATSGQNELAPRKDRDRSSISQPEPCRSSSESSYQLTYDQSGIAVSGEIVPNAPATMSLDADLVLPNGLFKRCHSCTESGSHKRCLHGVDGLLSPTKCSIFIRRHRMRYPGNNIATRQEWEMIIETAQASFPRDSQTQALDELEDEAGDVDDSPGPIEGSELCRRALSPEQHWMRPESAPITRVNETALGALPNLAPGHHFQRTRTAVQPHDWSSADEEKAIQKLQARGVQFESDTDDDDDDEEVNELPPRQIEPLRQPRQSKDLFQIDRHWDWQFEHRAYASSASRPYRKDIMRDLLKYQCFDRRRKFGNPHQEVRRSVQQVDVRAWVQVDQNTDPKEMPQLVEEEQVMTFGEFIDMPEAPVIAQGKHKDELEYTDRQERDRSGHGDGIAVHRVRRIREENRFPFVYNSK